MFFWLLSIFVCAHAASLAATPAPKACTLEGETIALTTSGYSLPLTSYNNTQICNYHFTVPQGYFAYVDLKAYHLQFRERVYIMDAAGVSVGSDVNSNGQHKYFNAQSWPVDFLVAIETVGDEPTQAQMSLNITVLPQTPNANIVKSYVTFPGSSAVFLYSNTWNDGESYKFTSKSGKIYVLGGTSPESSIYTNNNWNNVFVYEGDVFKGKLATVVQSSWNQKPYISISNEVILYCTKKVAATGAVMVTDYSNVQGVQHNMEYSSEDASSFGIGLDSTKMEAAFTVVSDRSKPVNLTLYQVQERAGPGVISYVAGGPIQNHYNSINVSVTQPPTVITGYANTIYLDQGNDVVWFTV